ncbi:MAG: hypothetical protein ACRENE_13425, partial [Polyangiaceae bacterium]
VPLGAPPPEPVTEPPAPVAVEGIAPPGRAPPASRVAAIVQTSAAALLLGAGFGAYAVSSAAQSDAARSCELVTSRSVSACDAYRVPVRAWDWVALGAWAGAGALGTWAVFTWARAPGASTRVGVGPAALRLEGAF